MAIIDKIGFKSNQIKSNLYFGIHEIKILKFQKNTQLQKKIHKQV